MSPHNKRSSNIPDWMELSLILARFDTRCHKFLFTLIAWRWHRFCWLFNFFGGHKPQIKLKPCVKQDIWHMSCLLLWEVFFLVIQNHGKHGETLRAVQFIKWSKENSKYSVLIFCFRIHADDSCQTPYFIHAAFQF